MSRKYPWEWNEDEVWDSILDPSFMSNSHGGDLLEWWKDRVGIDIEEYMMMEAAWISLQDDELWDIEEVSSFSEGPLKYLEGILRLPTTHPKQREVAKILRDRYKARINDKLHGSAGWMVTTGDKSIDPKNL